MGSKGNSILASVMGLGACAVAAGSGYLAHYTVHGKRQSYSESLAWQGSHYKVDWFFELEREAYTVSSFDGYVLHAQLCRNPKPSDRYVILSHGYTDNQMGMLKYMRLYLDRGYNCVIYDLRGHGKNAKAICTYSVQEGKDLYEMIRDTRTRYPDLKVLGLHGESLGAATTASAMGYGMWAKADGLSGKADIRASAKKQTDGLTGAEASTKKQTDGRKGVGASAWKQVDMSASPSVPVDFAVCDCGFADIENVLQGAAQELLDGCFGESGSLAGRSTFGERISKPSLPAKLMVGAASAASGICYGVAFSEMKPINCLAGNRVPMLFIHGAKDTFILPENSRRMAAETAGYSEYHLIPGADHAESVLVNPELYRKYLYGFLDHLGC